MAYGMTPERLRQLQNECKERHRFNPKITEETVIHSTFEKFERKNTHDVIPDKPNTIIRAKAEYNNIETPFGIASELLKQQNAKY